VLGMVMLAQATRLRLFLVAMSELEHQHRPLLLACAGLLLARVAWRRRAATLAAYAMILAWSQALVWLTRAGRPLAALQFTYADVDTLGLLALTALTLIWLGRRRLTGERALRLLGLALLMALLNQTAFLDNPFSPLFGIKRLLKLTQAACVIFMYQRTIRRTAEGGRYHSTAVPAVWIAPA